MKVLKYQVLQSEINHGTKENPDIEVILLPMERFSDEANLERSCAIAQAEAYNGEYTIEDDSHPEPVIPPTNEELAAENKLLKQQVSALTDQQNFYEDCIAEMAEVVYA